MKSVRETAVDILLRIEAAGQYADRALDAALSRAGEMSKEDKGLLTTLVYGVVERRITLDAVIDGLSSIAPSAIEKSVRMTLRVALYQLLELDRIPDHAAINEAVLATPRRSKGFVNAVLRQFCRNGKQIPHPDKTQDLVGYLSVKYSVPQQTAGEFCRLFGGERAERLFGAFSKHPPITVRVNTRRLSRQEFLERVPGAEPTVYAPFGAVLPKAAPLQELISSGLCFVQDEASQIAVAALDATTGQRVLDLCAAPGSKSFGAAFSVGDTGAVLSCDLHENKLSLIHATAKKLGLSHISVRAGDARAATPDTHGTFPRVICDVPCSGFGVLAKKPDIRYKNIEDAKGLVPIQKDILSAAAQLVEAGGVLLYSTCTLLPAENEEQVASFLATHPEFSLEPFTVGGISSNGVLTLAPDTHGTDGFFIAKLRKKDT